MKTFIQYLNEISPQLAARAFGARMYRTYANPSEHGAKQAGKNFEHTRKRAEAAGLKPDDITKDVERGIEREFYKTPDVRIKQTIGDKKGGKAFELLKRITKHTNLQNEDTLDETAPAGAAWAAGARQERNMRNPTTKGYIQQAKNIARRNALTKDMPTAERIKIKIKGKEQGREWEKYNQEIDDMF